MASITRGYTVNGIVLDDGAQVLYNGAPAVVVIAPGKVSPVRLFASASPWGNWNTKWADLSEAVRQSETVAKYGNAQARDEKTGKWHTITAAPLQPNTNPDTFIDYRAISDARAAAY